MCGLRRRRRSENGSEINQVKVTFKPRKDTRSLAVAALALEERGKGRILTYQSRPRELPFKSRLESVSLPANAQNGSKFWGKLM